jgi:hypothetical protein
MAYISQTEKKAIAPKVKAIMTKYGLKGSLSVDHHSTLVLTIKSGVIDFGSNDRQVNTYWIHDHYEGVAKDALTELNDALKGEGWYDESDIQTDYFCVKHYVNINVGKWDKPYVLTK